MERAIDAVDGELYFDDDMNGIDSYKSNYTKGWEALRKQRFDQQNKIKLNPNIRNLPDSDPLLVAFEKEAEMFLRKVENNSKY